LVYIILILACPDTKTFGLSLIVKENALAFGILIIIFGAYFCFLAYRFVKVTRVLTGIAFVLFVTIYVLLYHIPVDLKSLYFWLVIGGCILAGLILGFIVAAYPWTASVMLGCLIGFLFSEMIYLFVVTLISMKSDILFWILAGLFSYIGIYVGYKHPKIVFIMSSAFLGAYSILRVIIFSYFRALGLFIITILMNIRY
jgi:uncharacterized protein YbaR (Trm112 family)